MADIIDLVKGLFVEIFGHNIESSGAVELATHVADDVGLVFEFNTVRVVGPLFVWMVQALSVAIVICFIS